MLLMVNSAFTLRVEIQQEENNHRGPQGLLGEALQGPFSLAQGLLCLWTVNHKDV